MDICFYICVMEIFEPEVAYNSPDDYSIHSFIALIREGITFPKFFNFTKRIPFTMQEWASFLHISERTLHRYQQDKRRFDALQSEKIVEIALIYKKGVHVFGSKDLFNSWLETNNIPFGHIQPKTLLDSSFGIQLIHDELVRIEQGTIA